MMKTGFRTQKKSKLSNLYNNKIAKELPKQKQKRVAELTVSQEKPPKLLRNTPFSCYLNVFRV